jgi:hypothetical protein
MKAEVEIEAALHELQREEEEIREKKRVLHQGLAALRTKEKVDAVIAQIPAGSIGVLVEALKIQGEAKS